jgi:lipoate-protein ligase B
VGYVDGWRLQEAVATRARSGGEERLLFLEHDPVYTIGRRGTLDNLLVPRTELRDAGIAVYDVDRGGDITYHGPGQVVGYPIVRVSNDLHGYVRAIEGAVVDVLGEYGIIGHTIRGKTGVWVTQSSRPAKIAAIGIRVARRVATHGFAVNVSTDLVAFDRILPCGFKHDVTSLERVGVNARVTEVATACAEALAVRLGRTLEWSTVAATQDDELPRETPVLGARDLIGTAAEF